MNKNVKIFLDKIFHGISTFQTDKSMSAIITIDHNNTVYRARAFDCYEKVEEALQHPQRQFGPPPQLLATSGRMNAQGIPVFYSANSPEIAIPEIRPAVGSYVIVAKFLPLKELRLLDISTLDSLTAGNSSYFDPDMEEKLEITSFLRTLSWKLTMPVSGKKTDTEYLITQAIAEYLSLSEEHNFDGISFRSTQINLDEKDTLTPYNIVLFSKSA